MKKKHSIKGAISFILAFGILSTSLAQEVDQIKLVYEENEVPINLKAAIAQGLRKGHDQELRKFDKRLLDINWQDTKDEFWLPNIKLTLTSTDDSLGHALGTNSSPAPRNPTGVFALDFGEYVLFNWGKDYLQYLNDKSTFKRSAVKLTEEERDFKHDLIIKYLDLLTKKKIQLAKREQLRQASFIYRFNYDKAKLKKVSRQEFYQAKSEYLRAQDEYHEAKNDTQVADREFSFLVNDPIDTVYSVRDRIRFQKLKMHLDELIRLAKLNNPVILDSKHLIETSTRDYDIIKKDDLPLPTLSLKLGAYKYQFDDNDSSVNYENEYGNDSVDLVASINATWTLTGKDGMFNSRKRRRAIITKNLAIRRFQKAEHSVENTVKKLYRQLQSYERRMDILETNTIALDRSFDTILDNYTTGKTRFIDLKDALTQKTQRQIDLLTNKYLHARTKVLLAKTAGIEDFPGERIERLTTLESAK